MFKKISIYYNNDKAVAQSLLSFILSENTACIHEEVEKSYADKQKNKGVRYMEKLLLAIVGTVLIALGDILKEDSEDKKEK